MGASTIAIPQELRSQFRSLVSTRGGFYFKDHDMSNLENAILSRMKTRNIDSPSSYYGSLTISDDKESEFRELLNLLTINHTYFFRNEPQFKVKESSADDFCAKTSDFSLLIESIKKLT